MVAMNVLRISRRRQVKRGLNLLKQSLKRNHTTTQAYPKRCSGSAMSSDVRISTYSRPESS